MKLLTFTIPCYNSENYMRKCIESLLPGGDRVEILIVDDGSKKDNTAAIADEYEAKYPGIVRAIHQPNKGHGGAVNTGIDNATGLYFKVVDSDDWADGNSYAEILAALERFVNDPIDLLLANFVYENEGVQHKRKMSYKYYVPEGEVFGWDDVKRMPADKYLMMHAVFYRTQLLRDCNLRLPEHTFYVDNVFVTYPLPYVNRIYYVNVPFYRYFIGRADQSVKEVNLIRNLRDQFVVTRAVVDLIAGMPDGSTGNKRLDRILVNYAIDCIVVCAVFTYRSKSPEYDKALDELWTHIKESDPKLYRKIRNSTLGSAVTIPGELGKLLASKGYEIVNSILGAN